MKPADYLLIAFLLLTAVFSAFFLHNNLNQKKVEIYHKNKLLYSVALNKDQTIELPGLATVEIYQNRVRLINSSCRNHICEKQGWSSNLPIICVPNQISIIIVGSENDEMMITR